MMNSMARQSKQKRKERVSLLDHFTSVICVHKATAYAVQYPDMCSKNITKKGFECKKSFVIEVRHLGHLLGKLLVKLMAYFLYPKISACLCQIIF